MLMRCLTDMMKMIDSVHKLVLEATKVTRLDILYFINYNYLSDIYKIFKSIMKTEKMRGQGVVSAVRGPCTTCFTPASSLPTSRTPATSC